MGNGFSQTHPDRGDGFCNASFAINANNIDYLPLHLYAPKPAFYADFAASPSDGTLPLIVQCTDKSIGNPSGSFYNFGDGFNATGKTPTHTYRFPGTYTITLTIMKFNKTTNSLMTNSTTKTGIITVSRVPFIPPVAGFNASPAHGTAPLTVTFTDQSTGNPTFYNYDFGDGINATSGDVTHTYQYPGTYNVTLVVMKNDIANATLVVSTSVQTNLVVVNNH
jgi:PKD repeat protein